jgi:hypothetical protein
MLVPTCSIVVCRVRKLVWGAISERVGSSVICLYWFGRKGESSGYLRRGILQTTIAIFVLSVAFASSAADAAEVSDSSVLDVDKAAPGVTLERPENPCDQAMERAARLGLPPVKDEMTDNKLAFPWRLSEYAVSFQTDEFDVAQMSTVMTSLVTGRGSYAVKLGLPPHYDRFSASVSGSVQLDGCMPAPAEPSVTCTIIGTGRAGCFQLRFRLPPINSARASPRNRNEDRMETLHFFAGTDAFLSPRGKSKIVFTIPGDYSLLAELPGGHKLDPLTPT